MFDKVKALFGASKPAAPQSPIQLAMPLFASPDPIPAAAVAATWAATLREHPPLEVLSDDGVIASYRVDGAELMTSFMPVPVPGDEALHAVRTSWMWQEPDDAVRTHRAHAIVTALPTGDAVVDAWNVGFLCAMLMATGKGAALYWGNARQVHTARVVKGMFAGYDNPPVPIWVGVTISADDPKGPFSATTHGLEHLGHKEFEVLGTCMGIGDIRTTLLDLALYVLSNGPVLKHGQTFGPRADVQWSIRHAPSALVPGRQAIVLGIP
jgi:hypothetical protein